MKSILSKLKFELKYVMSACKMCNKKFDVSIMSIEETLRTIAAGDVSVIRFGDGEFSLIGGKGLPSYQTYTPQLSRELRECVCSVHIPNLLICLPETMSAMHKFKCKSRKNWMINFADHFDSYRNCCVSTYRYGNSFISRPYMVYKDKAGCAEQFELLLHIFSGKELVLIEGEFSRSGVGNGLFAGAKSVERVLCPSNNAWERFGDILKAALTFPKTRLMLTAIGPTSKPLALALVKRGYRVLDVGHLDTEYEWFLRGSPYKEAVHGKHTAEQTDEHIGQCMDKEYLSSIVYRIGNSNPASEVPR